MKATELRLGNLLDYNGKTVKVNTLGVDFHGNQTILASKENFLWNVSEIDGIKFIPLTEEWLLKFGFEKKYKNYEKGYFMFFKGSCSRISYKLSLIGINIKYVHQLQNLYFALTSEELTIKQQEQ